MKKMFAMLLALCLALSLAACGDPEPTKNKENSPRPTVNSTTGAPNSTTGTTQPIQPETPETAQLVKNFECTSSNIFPAGFRLAFTYDGNYRGGTVEMSADYEEKNLEGIFRCDENYDIVYMEIWEGEDVMVIENSFDEDHRLLSAKVQINDTLHYFAQNAYDAQGRTTLNKVEIPGKYTATTETTYNEAGQILTQRSETTTAAGTGSATIGSCTGYTYDENGYMQSMSSLDAQGKPVITFPATYEVKGDEVHYTIDVNGNQLCIVQDKQGHIIRMEAYAEGILTTKIESIYDEAGRLIRQLQETPAENTTVITEYAFTEDGRLQEQKQTVNGAESIIHRTTFETVEVPE